MFIAQIQQQQISNLPAGETKLYRLVMFPYSSPLCTLQLHLLRAAIDGSVESVQRAALLF